ncbi:hypothetical protein HP439_02615 [Sphingobacterium shayense]|uniref:hypothetical protein n=1 Tax=Sphingobacterium shayense TaxID=626343 RepID=UPI001557F048|nr:hypothetical protein [Sphingobacterium shayense]NQD69613.1 hypothetical protein [Sphingobacterium shayense]
MELLFRRTDTFRSCLLKDNLVSDDGQLHGNSGILLAIGRFPSRWNLLKVRRKNIECLKNLLTIGTLCGKYGE